MNLSNKYLSVFSPSTAQQRTENFADYWNFTQKNSGVLLEAEQNLSKKQIKLESFKANPVKLNQEFQQVDLFYRNYIELVDDPKLLDRKTLLMTCIYKFARHEWVGITGAWVATPEFDKCVAVTDKISRFHLAEEFSHTRLFHEMFNTLKLDKIEWVPLSPFMQKIYEIFPKLPESLMSPFAFVTELMGIIFYRHLDSLIGEIFADEPAAAQRLRELLDEITIDEIAHIGQRRNYLCSTGIKFSAWITPVLFRMFFNDIPETKILFDIELMIKEALAFDYNEIPANLMQKTWVPTYCVALA